MTYHSTAAAKPLAEHGHRVRRGTRPGTPASDRRHAIVPFEAAAYHDGARGERSRLGGRPETAVTVAGTVAALADAGSRVGGPSAADELTTRDWRRVPVGPTPAAP